jgi:hypothetical protein
MGILTAWYALKAFWSSRYIRLLDAAASVKARGIVLRIFDP